MNNSHHSNRERFEERKHGSAPSKQRPKKKFSLSQSPSKKHGVFLIVILAVILIATLTVSVVVKNHSAEEKAKVAETANKTTEETVAKDVYEETLFFGNSFVNTLKNYQIPEGATFLSKIGLNVEQALSFEDNNGNTISSLLTENDYRYIVLVFGENEVGWPYPKTFTEDYGKIIDLIKKSEPKAKIYLMAILPITVEADAKNEDGANNDSIRQFNERIRILAEEKNCVFVPPTASLFTDELTLIPESTTDGVHLTFEYNQIWLKDLKKVLENS